MRPYEVMVIFDAELDEETVRSAVTRYTQLIEGKGAQPGPVDYWGKRRFAYELKHRWEGYYVVLQAKAEPPAMDELHRVLSLADEVLRHKILRIPEQVYGKLTGPGAAPPRSTSATEPVPGPTDTVTSEPEAPAASEPDAGAPPDGAEVDAAADA
jgi:small subunit ribosomal protein S6